MNAAEILARPGGRARAWTGMLLADHGIFRQAWNNVHRVLPGLYRASQPAPWQFARYQRRYGIRSVINLRGPSTHGHYLLERDACARLGLTLHDEILRSREMPYVPQIHSFRALLDRVEYPALMHCKSGSDRAGMGAALALIFRGGLPVAQAARALSLRYGHLRFHTTGVLDAFFSAYLEHNAREPMDFMTWVDTRYDREKLTLAWRQRRQLRVPDWLVRRE